MRRTPDEANMVIFVVHSKKHNMEYLSLDSRPIFFVPNVWMYIACIIYIIYIYIYLHTPKKITQYFLLCGSCERLQRLFAQVCRISVGVHPVACYNCVYIYILYIDAYSSLAAEFCWHERDRFAVCHVVRWQRMTMARSCARSISLQEKKVYIMTCWRSNLHCP